MQMPSVAPASDVLPSALDHSFLLGSLEQLKNCLPLLAEPVGSAAVSEQASGEPTAETPIP